MKTELFSVFDAVLGRYNEPFNARTVDRAKAMFAEVCNNPNSDICKYPSEYTLFHIGSFDMETGLPTPQNTPISLGVAIEYKVEEYKLET